MTCKMKKFDGLEIKINIDSILLPVTSIKASMVISALIIVLLSVILFSVRQNILSYDNTSETVYFILTVVITYGIGSWLLLGYVRRTSRTSRPTATDTAKSRRPQTSPLISLLHIAVLLVQFAMLGIMLYVIFDRTSKYLMLYVNTITLGFANIIQMYLPINLQSGIKKKKKKS